MGNNSLTIELQPAIKEKKIIVKIDTNQFERLAANLGLFNTKFLESVERAEKEISQGKIKRLRSLKNLRS